MILLLLALSQDVDIQPSVCITETGHMVNCGELEEEEDFTEEEEGEADE